MPKSETWFLHLKAILEIHYDFEVEIVIFQNRSASLDGMPNSAKSTLKWYFLVSNPIFKKFPLK